MANVFDFSDHDNKYLTQQEKDAITAARQSAQAGKTSWAEANRVAEDIRRKYGYQGGTDGSGYTALPYASLLKGQVDAQRKKVSEASFDDFQKGTEYAALLERYTQGGQKAMKDTVGDISARTGGMASSFAAVAGQQAYSDYMQGLETAAQDAFDRNQQRDQEKLAVLQDAEQTEYARYLNRVAQDEAIRDRNYDLQRDAIEDKRYEEETAYAKGRDAIEDKRYEEETAYAKGRDDIADGRLADETGYQRGADSRDDARNRISAFLSAKGKLAEMPEELVKASGLSEAELKALEAYASRPEQETMEKYAGRLPQEETSTMKLSTAADMAEIGQFTDEVVQAFLAAGYNEDYLKSKYGYDPPVAKGEGGKLKNETAQWIAEQYDLGQMSDAELIDEIWRALLLQPAAITEEEANLLLDILHY